MRYGLAFTLVALLGWACTGEERARSTTRVPACSAPLCPPCACDLTFSCDEACGACDPECGECRTEGGNCRDTTAVDAGVTSADGGEVPPDAGSEPIDAGPCDFPPAQPEGAPCCVDKGIDACSLGLFCEAFDGRTQTVCYREGTREAGETCRDNVHCDSELCVEGVCALGNGDRCTGPGQCSPPAICLPGENVCGTDARLLCHPATHEGCGPNETCFFQGSGTECVEAGTGAVGTRCTAVTDCQPRLVCLLFEPDNGTCANTCDPGAPASQCPGGAECVEIPLGPFPIGYCSP